MTDENTAGDGTAAASTITETTTTEPEISMEPVKTPIEAAQSAFDETSRSPLLGQGLTLEAMMQVLIDHEARLTTLEAKRK